MLKFLMKKFNQIQFHPFRGMVLMFDNISDLFKPLVNKIAEYPQPLRALARLLEWVVRAVTTLALYVYLAFKALQYFSLYLITSLEHVLLNLVTNNQYQNEIAVDLDNEITELAREEMISVLGSRVQNPVSPLAELSEEEWNIWVQNSAGELGQQNNDPVATLNRRKQDITFGRVSGFTKIAAVINAFSTVITNPLPRDTLDIVGAIFLRALQTLAALILIPASIVIEVARFFYTTKYFVAISAMSLARGAGLAVITAPLYIWDGIKYAANGIRAHFHNENPQNEEAPEFVPNNQMNGLGPRVANENDLGVPPAANNNLFAGEVNPELRHDVNVNDANNANNVNNAVFG